MNRTKRRLAIYIGILLIYFCGSCALTPPTLSEPIVKSRSFDAPADTVWSAAVRAVAASGEFVNVAQKDSGLITFQKTIPITQVQTYALAPDGITWHNTHANVSILLENRAENTTHVSVNTKIWGSGINYWSGAPVQFNMGSRGLIEKEYLEKIAALVPGAKTYEWLEPAESQHTGKAAPRIKE